MACLFASHYSRALLKARMLLSDMLRRMFAAEVACLRTRADRRLVDLDGTAGMTFSAQDFISPGFRPGHHWLSLLGWPCRSARARKFQLPPLGSRIQCLLRHKILAIGRGRAAGPIPRSYLSSYSRKAIKIYCSAAAIQQSYVRRHGSASLS